LLVYSLPGVGCRKTCVCRRSSTPPGPLKAQKCPPTPPKGPRQPGCAAGPPPKPSLNPQRPLNKTPKVHANGLRHIRPDRRINEWRVPGRRSVSRAATNARQVAISLSGGEVAYFELDAMGQLLEMAKRDVDGDVTCLDLAPVPAGLQRCRWGGAGWCLVGGWVAVGR
jgi:hypothetical protein